MFGENGEKVTENGKQVGENTKEDKDKSVSLLELGKPGMGWPKGGKLNMEEGREGGAGGKEEDVYEFKTSCKDATPASSRDWSSSGSKKEGKEETGEQGMRGSEEQGEGGRQTYIVDQGSEEGETSKTKTENQLSQDGQDKAGRKERVTGSRGMQLGREEGSRRAGKSLKPEMFLDNIIFSGEDEDDPPYSEKGRTKKNKEKKNKNTELGNQKKPRLINKSELLDFLTQDAEEMELKEEETAREKIRQEEMGRGNRSRMDVAYQKQLSKKVWLKAIGAEEEGGSDEERDSNMDTETPSRKKKCNNRDFDEEEPQKKKKKGNKKLCKKMKKLLEVVMQYKDSDGRVLSEPFWKLPSREELPDYYEVSLRQLALC